MNPFKKIVELINSHSTNGLTDVPIEDEVLTSSGDIDYDEVLKHHRKYTNLLCVYVNNTRINLYAKILFKVAFFIITMWIWIKLVNLFCESFDIVFKIMNNTENTTNYMKTTINLLIALVPSLISLITSFIVIPQVIAKYLFYRKEEGNMIEIIKSLQSYDDVLYKHRYSKELLANKILQNLINISEDGDFENNTENDNGNIDEIENNSTESQEVNESA